MDVFLKEVKDQNIGKIEEDVFLSKYTTYKVGGLAKCVIYPMDISKLVRLIKLIKKYNVKYKVIGNGSNLLFSDKRFDGVIIKLNNLDKLEIVGNKMIVGAGYSLMKLSLVAMKNSLTGLEFAAGIPGTVGGAIIKKWIFIIVALFYKLILIIFVWKQLFPFQKEKRALLKKS